MDVNGLIMEMVNGNGLKCESWIRMVYVIYKD
jgi:hypothetical protein